MDMQLLSFSFLFRTIRISRIKLKCNKLQKKLTFLKVRGIFKKLNMLWFAV